MAALDGDFSNWTIGLGGSIIGAVGGFVAALLNRGPALQVAMDARLKTLIDGYEKSKTNLNEVHNGYCRRDKPGGNAPSGAENVGSRHL